MAAGDLTLEESAIGAVVAAVAELSATACGEIVRRLGDRLVLLDQNHRFDLTPLAHGDARYVGGLRAVAESIGHPPSTTEYRNEYDRRRTVGDGGLPSIASVVRRFGSWPAALAASGLGPPAPVRAVERRRRYQRRVVHRYTDERIAEALRACARQVERTPMVRDYAAWREDLIAGRPGARPTPIDVPHYRTILNRYGGWDQALSAAGFDGRRQARTATTSYSDLP